jgi:hypothetical protein
MTTTNDNKAMTMGQQMKRDDGGPLHPCREIIPNPEGCTAGGRVIDHTGASLRDWFAGQALAGDWGSQSEDQGGFANDSTDELLQDRAALVYRMADAMLKERAK